MYTTSTSRSNPDVRHEVKELMYLCGPIIISSLLLFALNIEDQVIVGQLLTKEDLAAAAIGNTYFNLFWYFLVGINCAVDTFGSQAVGAKQYSDVGRWAQRGLFVCGVVCVPIILISVTCTEWIVLNVFQQDPLVASKSALFVRWLMPGLPFLVVADILRRWLQVQGHLSPAVYTGIIVNLLNIGFNFWFVQSFGLIGSPLATSLSRIFQVILLVALIKRYKLDQHSTTLTLSDTSNLTKTETDTSMLATQHVTNVSYTTFPAWSWSAILQRKPLNSFLSVAMPGAAMLLLEAGAFETSTLIVGGLKNINILDAHFIMLSLCGFSFVAFPLSVSIAASIRVGHLLGENKPFHARMVGWLSVGFGVGFMTVNGILIASCKNILGYIFTDNLDIVHLVSQIALIAATFQVVDGLQGTAAGALRGCGRQRDVALTNLLGFWILGIPIGAILAFSGAGVFGVWWGLTIGLTVAALVSVRILSKIDWVNESKLALRRVGNGDGNGDAIHIDAGNGGGRNSMHTMMSVQNDTDHGGVALLLAGDGLSVVVGDVP